MKEALEIMTKLDIEFHPDEYIFMFFRNHVSLLESSGLDMVYKAFVQRMSGKNFQ